MVYDIPVSPSFTLDALDFPLTALHLRMHCQATTPLDLDGSRAGMQLRGALGNVMSRAFCDGDRAAPGHAEHCPVCWLLAANEAPGKERRGYALVPPHGLRVPLQTNDRFEFGLTLFASACRQLPYFLLAIPEMGQIGVGRGRGRFSLRSVEAINPITGDRQVALAEGEDVVRVPTLALTHADVLGEARCLIDDVLAERDRDEDSPLRVTLHFRTPTRLITDGRLAKTPDFGVLFQRLLKHLDDLAQQFCETPWRRPYDAMQGLHDAANRVRMIDARTRWIDLESHSSRREASSPVGGFVGSATYLAPIDVWRVLMPWVLWGTVSQVGRDVVKGNGVVRIERVE
jgi:hypothetical protein